MTLTGRCTAICAGLMLSIGFCTAPVWSQTAPGFDVTATTITSTAVIDSFVETQASEMRSGDRDKVVAARQALLLPGTANAKSAKFLEIYSRAIATKLMSVAGGNDAHARLNAGIVVGKVAEMGGSAELSPLIVKLIGDDASGVSLYGIRAASFLIPRVLADKNLADADKMVPAISGALQKHPTSEAIVAESYLAMIRILNTPKEAALLGVANVTAATPRVVDGLLDLMSIREPQFGSGELIEPMAELPAIVFLTKQSSWAAMNDLTRARAVKSLLSIGRGSVKELEIEFDRKPSSRPRLQALQRVVKDAIGQGLSVIGSFVKDPALSAEADKLKVFNTLTPPAQWKVTIQEISAAFSLAFKIDPAAASQPAK